MMTRPRAMARLRGARIILGLESARLRFTLSLVGLASLVSVALWAGGGTRLSSITMAVGFAPRDLTAVDGLRLIFSALATGGHAEAMLALGAVAMIVGALERVAGPLAAGLAFWGVHVATLLSESAVSALMHVAGSPLGTALFYARDIGPSAGYVGCLGVLAAAIAPRRLRWAAVAAGAAGFTVVTALAVAGHAPVRDVSADLAHLIAFVLGVAAGNLHALRGRLPRIHPAQVWATRLKNTPA